MRALYNALLALALVLLATTGAAQSGFAPNGGCLPGYRQFCTGGGDVWHPRGCGCAPVQHVDLRPRIAYGLNEQGRAAFAQGLYQDALALFQQAANTWPDPAYAQNVANAQRSIEAKEHFDRAMSLFAARRWSEAIDEFQQTLSVSPDWSAARDNIKLAHSNEDVDASNVALNAKNWDEAIRLLREANRWYPGFDPEPGIHGIEIERRYDEAIAAFNAGDWALAIRRYRALVAFDPAQSAARFNLALALGNAIDPGLQPNATVGSRVDELNEMFSILAALPGPERAKDMQSVNWAYSRAAWALSSAARSDADWAEAQTAYARWAALIPQAQSAQGATTLMEHRLAARVDAANRAADASLTVAAVEAAARAAHEAHLADAQLVSGKQVASIENEVSELHTAQGWVQKMITVRSTALEQLADTAESGSPEGGAAPCIDTSAGCIASTHTPEIVHLYGRPSILPPLTGHESDAQLAIRSRIEKTEADIRSLSASVETAPDPIDQASAREQLQRAQSALLDQADQARAAGISVTLKKRKHGS